MSNQCQHGSLRRSCEVCERDVEIERITSTLRRIVASGILCAPGCCGSECACDEARAIAKEPKR